MESAEWNVTVPAHIKVKTDERGVLVQLGLNAGWYRLAWDVAEALIEQVEAKLETRTA